MTNTPPRVITHLTQEWFNPSVECPPFGQKLLLMLAGSRSNDAGRSFKPYTVVLTAKVTQRGTSDEYEDTLTIDDFAAGDRAEYLDFQFYLEDEDGMEIDDWYSDAIVAWACYPEEVAKTAIEIESKRQADNDIANWSATL